MSHVIAQPAATDPGSPKPGPKTTEFWTTVFTSVISLAIAVASITDTHFNPGPWQAIVPSIAVLAAALATALYGHSRAKVKVAASSAAAGGASAPSPVSPSPASSPAKTHAKAPQTVGV